MPEKTGLVDSIFRVQELADYIVPFAIRVVCDLGLAELLRSDHPLSLRGAYPLLAANFEAWARFDYTVRTGKPAFDHVHGRRYYDYLADAPYDSERFDDIQTAGILLELPYVAERAGAVIERAGVADRCEVVAGSFFDTMPEGADAYVLKRVLYDWGDEEAAALLAKIRDAMRNDSTLLVLDPVIEPGNDFDPGKIYDLLSMTMLGGRARSRDELTELFSASGFELTQVIQTDMFPVVEGRPSAARRAPVGAGARASDES